MPIPTYAMYGVLTAQRGARSCERCRGVRPRAGFALDLDALDARRLADAAVVWLCAPNNPTAPAETRARPSSGSSTPARRPRVAARPSSSTRPTSSSIRDSVVGLRDALPGAHRRAHAVEGVRAAGAARRLCRRRAADHRAPRARSARRAASPRSRPRSAPRPCAARSSRAPTPRRSSPSATGSPRGLADVGLPAYPSVTNFLLCRIGDRRARPRTSTEHLLRAGIVTRTFGPAQPAARTPALHGPDARRRTSGSWRGPRAWSRREGRMTSAATGRADARDARDAASAVTVDLDGTGDGRDRAPGVGFYDHLLTSLAHHSLIDIEIAAPATSRSTSTTRSRTWRWRWAQALSAALGRPRRHHPLRRRARAHGRVARAAARSTCRAGRTPCSTCRSGASASATLSTQLVEHALGVVRADRRRDAPPVAARAATTTTSPRPRSRRSRARCARPWRSIRAAPASHPRRAPSKAASGA